jgi:hypothetical protein
MKYVIPANYMQVNGLSLLLFALVAWGHFFTMTSVEVEANQLPGYFASWQIIT